MLAAIILFSILRFDTGWDYAAYTEWIGRIHKFDPDNERFSLLWQAIFLFANKFDFPHLGIALSNVITYLCIYASCKIYFRDDERGICNALLFYSLWPFFYLATWSTIRQQLAVSIGLLMLCCLFNKKYTYAGCLYFVAFLCHPSALVLILLLPAYLFRKSFSVYSILIISLCAVAIFSSLSSVLDWLAIVEFERYEGYLKVKDSFGAKLIVLNTAMLIWLFIAFFNNQYNYWAKNDFYKVCLGLVIISFICDICIFFTASTNIISRITTYFEIPLILVMYQTFGCYKSQKIQRPVFTCLLILLFFTYLHIATGKESVRGSSPFVPYKCILIDKT